MTGWTRRSALAAGLALGLGGGRASAQEGELTPDELAALGAPARDAVARGDVPGAISLVWRKGELVSAELAGYRDRERGLPMTRDTIMGVASMSKPVTVAAALTLVDQGVMALDDPITKWAPEFAEARVLRQEGGPLDDAVPAPRAITIDDLMSHRSGIGYGPATPGPLGAALMQALGFGIESPLTPDEWLRAIAALPLAYAPGERFHYSHSIDVLGLVIARATGADLHDTMRRQLFDPLGMADTGFWIPPEKRDRAATLYMGPAPGQLTPTGLLQSWVGEAPAAFASAGEGLVSTADDYLRFARMLVQGGEIDGRRILKPETVRLMTTDRTAPAQRVFSPVAPDWRSYGFGLGVQVITNPASNVVGAGRAGAFGWSGAFGGWWQGDPAEDMVLLWLQHVVPAPPDPGSLAQGRMPYMPGVSAMAAFQNGVYAALDT